MKTLNETINSLKNFLADKIGNPRFSAEYIVSEILALKIPELYLQSDKIVPQKKLKKIAACAKRRAKGEPLQYIFGKAYFRNLTLKIGSGVLIPRPETELITDKILDNLPYGGTFCDIGVGSGAIALSVASERPDAKVFASEISNHAIKYAKLNKKKLKLKNIILKRGSLFAPFKNEKFNVIAANLPYIKNSDLKKLPCEIRNYEPETALRGGKDGLDIVREFFIKAISHSKANAFIIAEIAPQQVNTMKSFLSKISGYDNFHTSKDLNNKNRFVSVIFQSKN